LLSQDRLPAVDGNCCHLLANRLVCAICCPSASSLALVANPPGGTVLGFVGELQVVLAEGQCLAPYDAYLTSCLLAGLGELLAGRPVGSALSKMKEEFLRVSEDVSPGSMDMSTAEAAAFLFYENAYAANLVGDANRCL
jgi:hypothetical protein